MQNKHEDKAQALSTIQLALVAAWLSGSEPEDLPELIDGWIGRVVINASPEGIAADPDGYRTRSIMGNPAISSLRIAAKLHPELVAARIAAFRLQQQADKRARQQQRREAERQHRQRERARVRAEQEQAAARQEAARQAAEREQRERTMNRAAFPSVDALLFRKPSVAQA